MRWMQMVSCAFLELEVFLEVRLDPIYYFKFFLFMIFIFLIINFLFLFFLN